MKKLKIKKFLEKIAEIDGGSLKREHIDELAKDDDGLRFVQKLIGEKYLDEYTKKHLNHSGGQIELTYFRISEKGYQILDPFYQRFWFFIKNDIKVIIIATITALITSVITILVSNFYGK